ncbi:hypothetical protein CY34DRAFT_807850 [Suillus luteus UH-Slu-Lm8-n1]|uniref:Uncharacterized protein n=1 Tax=Suillus luteus UH-Slu-Lm8-n1 TaxID=930992 RepID=A0A0D0AP45_9AGAM|nr:hypothetical protein CY34DRAFT_807850 [Suillus luteus UH-Slu-Lm8-n1]
MQAERSPQNDNSKRYQYCDTFGGRSVCYGDIPDRSSTMIPLSVETTAAVLIKMYCSLVGTEVTIMDAPMEIKLSGNVSCRGDTLELKPSGVGLRSRMRNCQHSRYEIRG